MSVFGEPVVPTNDSPDADAALGYGSEDTTNQTPTNEGYSDESNSEEWDGTPEDFDEDGNESEGEPEQDPQQQQPQRIFGKYNSIEEATEGYKNMEAFIGRQGQEIGQLRQQNQMLMQLLQQAGQLMGQPQNVPGGNQTQQQEDPEKLWEELANNPKEAIAKIVQPMLQQQQQVIGAAMQQFVAPLQPVVQNVQQEQVKSQLQNEFKQQFQTLVQQYPDVAEYMDDMAREVQKNPMFLLVPGAIEQLYKSVRHDRIQSGQAMRNKRMAKMPSSGGGRVNTSGNDKLLDEYLGPPSSGGIWG